MRTIFAVMLIVGLDLSAWWWLVIPLCTIPTEIRDEMRYAALRKAVSR